MDDTYLCKHLKKIVGLMCQGRPYARVIKTNEKYVFGTKDYEGRSLYRNVVTKQIAIYLVIGAPGYEKKKRKIRRRRKNKFV